MLKCLRPQSTLPVTRSMSPNFGDWDLTDWLMRLLWRLKPFHPPSIA